jgi:hypothetical protein
MWPGAKGSPAKASTAGSATLQKVAWLRQEEFYIPFREGRSVRESVGMGLVNQSGNLHGLRSMLPPSPSQREDV